MQSHFGRIYRTQPMPAVLYDKMVEKKEGFNVLKDTYYQEIKNSLDGIGVTSSNLPGVGGIGLEFNGEWIGIITYETVNDTNKRILFEILIRNGEMPHPKLENVKEILRSFVEKYSNQWIEARKASKSIESGLDSQLQMDTYTTRGLSNTIREMTGLPVRVGQGKKRKTRKSRSRKAKKTRKH